MHGRRGMANQGFRSAQTDRQFEYLQAIEESKRVGLISLEVEGECRAGRTGLPLHQLLRGVVGGKQRRIMDARHLGVTSEEVRHGRGIAGRSKADAFEAEGRKGLIDENFCASIEWAAM